MRQHVNPLSNHFSEIEKVPPLTRIFANPRLPLHLDIGSAGGEFLFELASKNKNWNYLGIEIREKLVNNAKLKAKDLEIQNLYFVFGNANKIFSNSNNKFLIGYVSSISFNFPDPWFKNKHHKRRVVQPELINLFSNSMQKGSFIIIKTDVKQLFEYMDLIISNNLNFKKIDFKYFQYEQSFNPNKTLTNREKYVIKNQLNIFERIYTKI